MTIFANQLPPQIKPIQGDGEMSESSLNSVNVVLGELDLSNDLTGDMERSPLNRDRPLSHLRNSFRPRSRSHSRCHAGESDAASVASRASVSSKASLTSWVKRTRRRSQDGILSQITVIPVPQSPNNKKREERMRWKEFARRMSCFDDESYTVQDTSMLDDFVEEFNDCSYFCRCLMDDAVETFETDREIQEQSQQMQMRHSLLP